MYKTLKLEETDLELLNSLLNKEMMLVDDYHTSTLHTTVAKDALNQYSKNLNKLIDKLKETEGYKKLYIVTDSSSEDGVIKRYFNKEDFLDYLQSVKYYIEKDLEQNEIFFKRDLLSLNTTLASEYELKLILSCRNLELEVVTFKDEYDLIKILNNTNSL